MAQEEEKPKSLIFDGIQVTKSTIDKKIILSDSDFALVLALNNLAQQIQRLIAK